MVGVGGFGGFRRERMRETQLFEIVAAYDHSAEALAKCQAEDVKLSNLVFFTIAPDARPALRWLRVRNLKIDSVSEKIRKFD